MNVDLLLQHLKTGGLLKKLYSCVPPECMMKEKRENRTPHNQCMVTVKEGFLFWTGALRALLFRLGILDASRNFSGNGLND